MEIFSELIASELPKKEMSRSMSGLGKCLLEMNRLEELDEFLNQLEEDLKSSNDIKDLIEAKKFFSNILELSQSEPENSNTSDEYENKLHSSRSLYWIEIMIMQLMVTFLSLKKTLNGIMELQKRNFLAYFLFWVIIIVLPLMEEVAYLIFYTNNDKKFF